MAAVPETQPQHVVPLLRGIASFGMPGVVGPALDVDAETWQALSVWIDNQKIIGLAYAALEGGALRLPEEAADELAESHTAAMHWSVMLERQLVIIAGRLEAESIPSVVLKGPAVAHTAYPDPAWRGFGDLDVLVRTEDWQRACEVVSGLGFERHLPEPRPGFDERFGKAAELMGEGGMVVDLHRTLVLGAFGLWIDPGEMFSRNQSLTVGGRELRRLDDSGLLLHACLHASLGWRPALLGTVRDVVQTSRLPGIDWDVVADRAQRWRIAAVVRHAFGEARSLLGATFPEGSQAVEALTVRRSERKALEVCVGEKRGRALALSTLRAIPGLRMKAAYARSLALPGREFLAARSNGRRPSYLRRLAVPARRLVRRRG